MSSNLIGATGVLGSMPTVVNVFVNGVPYDNAIPILDARLVQKFGHHDRFHIRMEVPPQNTGALTNLALWPDDVPIVIKWGRQPDINVWYGYVNSKEVSSVAESGTNAPQVSYVCIGTSTVLDPAVNRKWENVSSTYIASTIAAENGLRAVTSPTNTVLTYETQVGESNHQFLQRMALKTGLRYWASGGTLYMINPLTAIQGIGQTAIPTFSSNKTPQIIDTCRNFQYRRGQNVPGSVVSNRVVFGLDAGNGTPFSAVSPAPAPTKRTSINTTYATQTVSDAHARANAWSSLSQFWIQANAQLYGSTNVYPGKVIQLVGNALADNASGAWLVSEVEHTISLSGKAAALDTFISTSTIIRNTDQQLAAGMANTQPVSPEFTTMMLNTNGNWLSSNQSVVQLA